MMIRRHSRSVYHGELAGAYSCTSPTRTPPLVTRSLPVSTTLANAVGMMGISRRFSPSLPREHSRHGWHLTSHLPRITSPMLPYGLSLRTWLLSILSGHTWLVSKCGMLSVPWRQTRCKTPLKVCRARCLSRCMSSAWALCSLSTRLQAQHCRLRSNSQRPSAVVLPCRRP